jgi:hypothetical protein
VDAGMKKIHDAPFAEAELKPIHTKREI